MDNIVFRIKKSTLSNGNYTNATIHAIGGTLSENGNYQKYMVDVIAHSLTNSLGIEVDDDRFTYTFPFKMA